MLSVNGSQICEAKPLEEHLQNALAVRGVSDEVQDQLANLCLCVLQNDRKRAREVVDTHKDLWQLLKEKEVLELVEALIKEKLKEVS